MLKEQNLTAAGLTDGAGSVELGKLLRAAGLVLVEQDPRRPFAMLRLLETQHGYLLNGPLIAGLVHPAAFALDPATGAFATRYETPKIAPRAPLLAADGQVQVVTGTESWEIKYDPTASEPPAPVLPSGPAATTRSTPAK